MIAYVLAYHLALYLTESQSIRAAIMAADWLMLSDEKSILKEVKDYPIPKNAELIVYENPLGITALLEREKVAKAQGKLSYSGTIWDWKVGDQKASVALATLKDIEFISIPSPIKILSEKKQKRSYT